MGRAARANATPRAEGNGRPVHWYSCEVCGQAFPSQTAPDQPVARLDVCQRCCVADLARLVRRNFETVRMLPTVRVLRGLRPVVKVGPP